MRPVNKGEAPKTYINYRDAQPDLVSRIGDYCSYCERQISPNLAVEHVQPKSISPDLETEWRNFLLGCTNCNSAKGKKEVILDDYFWPHQDNTFLAIRYLEAGRVTFNPRFKEKAQNIIELVGLDKEPGHPNPKKIPTSADDRWKRRLQIWTLAQSSLTLLTQNDNNGTRDYLVGVAITVGMFSIWMKVFEGDEDMRCRFINAFTGTARNCFDEKGRPVSRPGGKI